MAAFFVETERGTEGPYTIAKLAALKAGGELTDDARVSVDRESWETLGSVLDRASTKELRAAVVEGIFENCPRCDNGVLDRLEKRQKTATVGFSLALLALATLAGLGARAVLAAKLDTGEALTLATPGAALLIGGSIGLLAVFLVAQYGFRLSRKWAAWLRNACPFCEDGFVRRDQASMAATIAYFLRAFAFREIVIPVYKTLTYQWLWRDPPDEDDDEAIRPGPAAIGLRLLGYSLVIFGAVPFLWLLTGRDSAIGLGVSIVIIVVMIKLIFAENEEDSPYPKGLVFLMLPLYYCAIVEILRWAWILSLGPDAVPPDASDLYLLGVEKAMESGIFFDIPIDLVGLSFFSGEVDSALTTAATFFTKLLLDASLIAALAKAFINAAWSAKAFHRTGERDVRAADVEALGTIEELSIQRDPRLIDDLEDGLAKITGVLLRARDYVRGVASAAEPGSEQRGAAERSLALIASADLDEFAKTHAAEVGKHVDETRWIERGLATVVCIGWVGLFTVFFVNAIQTATAREVEALLVRAAEAKLVDDPLTRRSLYARALAKDHDHHVALRRAAATDMDVAARRVDLLDVDAALIDIDRGFRKMIFLQDLTGLEKNPYTDEQQALSARAYALRGRAFFLRQDRERAVAELRKERTQATRRLLFALALDDAAETLGERGARDRLAAATAELGIDPGWRPARLALLADALVTLHGGELPRAAKELAAFTGERADAAGNEVFSSAIRDEARLLLAQTLLRIDRAGDARATLEALLASTPEHGEARLGLAHLLRLGGDADGARSQLERAAKHADPAIAERARLAAALLDLGAGDAPIRARAADALVATAERRGADGLFRGDLRAFVASEIDGETLRQRAARWNDRDHRVHVILTGLVLGMDALARDELAGAARELRAVVAAVPLEPRRAATDPVAEVARALLEGIQIRREGRSWQPELHFHDARLAAAAALVRREITLILFPPEQIARSLELALGGREAPERARAIAAVSEGGLLDAGRLLPLPQRALADDDAEVRLAALEALGRVGPAARVAAAGVAKTLGDPDDRVRRAAVRVMEVFGGEAAARALVGALDDADPYVRRDAAYALAKLGADAHAALAPLLARLDDPEVMVRDAAFAGAKALGEPGAAALAKRIGETDDSYVSIQAVRHVEAAWPAIAETERARITGFLIAVLTDDPDPSSRRWAAQRLARAPRDDRIAADAVRTAMATRLAEALAETTDPAVGIGIAAAMLRAERVYGIDGAPAVAHYVSAVRSLPALREDILASLLAPGIGRAAVPIVIEMVGDEALADDGQRLLRSLIENAEAGEGGDGGEDDGDGGEAAAIGDAVLERLPALLGDEDEDRAGRATDALLVLSEALDPAASAPGILKLLRHGNEAVRWSALDAASFEIDDLDDATIGALREGLGIEDDGVRAAHFSLLRYLGFEDGSVAAAIGAMARDEDADAEARAAALWAAARTPAVRGELAAAATELARSDDDDVARAAIVLDLAVRGPKAVVASAAEPRTRELAVAALVEWIGETDAGAEQEGAAIEALVGLLDDGASAVAGAALAALVDLDPGDALKPALTALAAIADGDDEDAARHARVLLVATAPADADPATIVALVRGDDESAAYKTLEILTTWGAEGGDAARRASVGLVAALASPEEGVRETALEGLATLGAAAHEELGRELERGSAERRRAVLAAIAAQGEAARPLAPSVVGLLASAEDDPGVIRAAVHALGRIGHADARGALRDLAIDARGALRAECWIALGRLGVEESGAQLEALLAAGEGDGGVIARGLVEVDRPRGIRFLIGALRARYGPVGAQDAARLLGKIGAPAKAALADLDALASDGNPALGTAARAAALRIRGA